MKCSVLCSSCYFAVLVPISCSSLWFDAAGRTIKIGSSAGSDSSTISGGLALVPAGQAERWTLLIEPGKYRERVWVNAGIGPVTFQGLGPPEATLLVYGCCPLGNSLPGCSNAAADWTCRPQHPGVGMSRGVETLLVETDDFVMLNMSVANDACGYDHTLAEQSEAVQLLGDRAFFHQVRFLGGQDTVFTGPATSRQYFLESYINGSYDSIYGSSSAVFDQCSIAVTNAVTAHRGSGQSGFESLYLFVNSSLVHPAEGDTNYPAAEGGTNLGRPWGPLATVVYKDTFMGSHIAAYGWNDWDHQCDSGPNRGEDCFLNFECWCRQVTFAEYRSFGPGATFGERVLWSRQLSAQEAAAITPSIVLRGWLPFDDRSTSEMLVI